VLSFSFKERENALHRVTLVDLGLLALVRNREPEAPLWTANTMPD